MSEVLVEMPDGRPVYAHVTRWPKARVLAECDAKRRIVTMYQAATERVKNPASADARWAARCEQFALDEALKALCLPMADRPGYREEWRP